MKRTLTVLFAFISIFGFLSNSNAQELIMKGSGKDLYVEHSVLPKENFYSVGRLFSISPKEIAAYNKLDMNKGLNLGQVIRIPLVPANFSTTGTAGVAVYKISGGKKTVVGYVGPSTAVTTTVETKQPVVTKNPVIPKEAPKKDPVTPETKPPVNNTPIELSKQEKTVQKDPEPAKASTDPIKYEPITSSNAGYFKTAFDDQVRAKPISKNQTMTSGIFRTASGWQDNKYYVLVDGIDPGTIVKIMNPDNNNLVYAKVLGEMSGIRQNEGLNIRISNAAASILDIRNEEKFVVKIAY